MPDRQTPRPRITRGVYSLRSMANPQPGDKLLATLKAQAQSRADAVAKSRELAGPATAPGKPVPPAK